MSRVDDFIINKKVKAILVRHLVDTSQIKIITIKGIVRLAGHIRFFSTAHKGGVKKSLEELTKTEEARLLHIIDMEISRIDGVKDIQYNFDNWVKEKGMWVKKQISSSSG